jgi:hypothetical protein
VRGLSGGKTTADLLDRLSRAKRINCEFGGL